MFADERKNRILALLEESLSLSVVDLAVGLGVSETTVRRDLHDLEVHGRLKRTHGGAVALEVATFEPSLQDKVVLYPEEKINIARIAIERIYPGDAILLDAGATTLEIAKRLPDVEMTVVTNSLSIAHVLSSYRKLNLFVLGGELGRTTGALVGPMAVQMLRQLNVDKVFLGATAIDLERGITTHNPMEAATKRAMIRAAKEVLLVADSSKLGQISLVKFCEIADVHTFVTNNPLPTAYAEMFAHFGVQVRTPTSNFKPQKERKREA